MDNLEEDWNGLQLWFFENLLAWQFYKFIFVTVKWSACHERGTKKKSESPTGFEPMTSQTPGRRSIHLSYGELTERCLGGHRFKSCRGLRFFICPTLVTCWSLHCHICFTELKIYHLSFFHFCCFWRLQQCLRDICGTRRSDFVIHK